MKTIRKMISVLLVATIFLASVSFLGVLSPVAALTQYSVSDIDAKFEELRLLYPQGAGWNRNNGTDEYGASKAGSKKCACSSSCVANCSCACGHYNGAYQCAGFAKIVSKRLFGYDCGARQTQYYDISIGSSVNIDAIVPGDIIRYRYSSGSAYDHSIVVIRVTTDRIYYVDCNGGGGGCRINWERSYTKSELKTRLGYKLVDGSVYAYGYVMHYKGNNYSNEVTYTHTFNFDSDGGSGTMSSLNIASGESLIMPECGFTREGYTFVGWNAKRIKDNKWHVSGEGWFTEEEIVSNGFSKHLYNSGSSYKLDDSWTNGLADGGYQYSIVAVWKPYVLTIDYNANGGLIDSTDYYLVSSLVYKTSSGESISDKIEYGTSPTNGLYNATTFNLVREGYGFVGWCLSPDGGTTIFDQDDTALKAEDICPALTEGNQSVVLYAIWEEESIDESIKSVMLRSIGQKTFYYVGDSLVTDGISLLAENADGTYEIVKDGFVCSPSTLSSEGMQKVTVNYKGHTVTYDVCVTKEKTRTVNATAKSASTGYLLPSKSSETIANQGSYANDTLQVLCKDGDFYLAFIPWAATSVNNTNGVLLYLPVSSVTLSSSVPSADEYYSLNPDGSENAWFINNSYIYHRPDGGNLPVKYGDTYYTTMGPIETGTAVRVLFELNGYYCVQTDKYTGFVNKTDVCMYPSVSGFTQEVEEITIEAGGEVQSGFEVCLDYTDGSVEGLTDDYDLYVPDVSIAGIHYAVISYGEFYTLVQINVTEKTYQSGDVNGDGTINMFDYISLKSYYFSKTDLSPDELVRADCNNDGKINMFDYLLVKQWYYSK